MSAFREYVDHFLHLAHLNVRSMTGGHKLDMLKSQIELSGIDVFSLSETWLSEAIPVKVVEIPSFNVCRLDRSWCSNDNSTTPKRGGGLAVYIRKGIQFSDTKFGGLIISGKDLEMQWVSLSLKHVRPVVIVNVYRPPQGNLKACCKLILDSFDKAHLTENTEIYVMGDLNTNYEDSKSSTVRELDFTMNSLGLSQLVKEPTRIVFNNDLRKTSTLDLIFTNSEFIQSTRTMDLNISDHLAVMTTRKKVWVKPAKVQFQGRSYKNYIKEDFQEGFLENINWDDYLTLTNVNQMWTFIKKSIFSILDPMCPIKTYKVPEAREPWLTNEALEAIRDKDKLLNKARRTKSANDWELARRARNSVGREIENLRVNFLKDQQTAHKNDPKKFWKSIASVFPNKRNSQTSIWLKNEDENTKLEQRDIPNYMNSFFTGIGPKLAKMHSANWEYFGRTSALDIPDLSTDVDEIIELCKDIEILKSSGIDGIASRICKDAFLVIPDKLAHLFNCSLQQGIFPDEWKAAGVVPLFKGGDRELVGNYKPVSLLPLPGKMLEKIVHSRFTNFFEEIGFLSNCQGGFRKGFSTVSTIADLTDDLFKEINLGRTTLAAFIDLKKAFDTVDCEILLKKLHKAGVRNSAYNWCVSYMSDRSQKTLANNMTSDSLNITCGVPQGSVLGPLFFLIYINDMQEALRSNIKLYADDTILYQSGVNAHEAADLLQADLDRFCKWCSINKLSINTKKKKLMVFGSRSKVKKAKKVKVYVNGDKLQMVPTFKYLGFILDSTLNYNHHINSVIRTVLHKMTLLAKMKKYLKSDVATQIYRSMLLPYFDYADIIYHKSNSNDLVKLQRLQNRCLRICLGFDRRHSSARAHKVAAVPFLQDRRVAHVLKFMFIRKTRQHLLNNREIRTRAHDAPLFLIDIPRCEAFKRCVGYHGSIEWNALDIATRNTDSYLAFKFNRKKEMLKPLKLIRDD